MGSQYNKCMPMKKIACTAGIICALSSASLMVAQTPHAAAVEISQRNNNGVQTCTLQFSDAERAQAQKYVKELSEFFIQKYKDSMRAALLERAVYANEADAFTEEDLLSPEEYATLIQDKAFDSNLFVNTARDKEAWERVGSPLQYYSKDNEILIGYEQYKYKNWPQFIAVYSLENALSEKGREHIKNVNTQSALLRVIDSSYLDAIKEKWEPFVDIQLASINECLSNLGSSVRYTGANFEVPQTESLQEKFIKYIVGSSSSSSLSSAVGSSNWIHF